MPAWYLVFAEREQGSFSLVYEGPDENEADRIADAEGNAAKAFVVKRISEYPKRVSDD